MVTERSGEPPVDLAEIQADDALLDALGHGEPAPDDDDLAGLLAGWRADLGTDLPADLPSGIPVPLPARRRTGVRRMLAGAVAAAVLLGGAALGARHSGPDNPLWPLTRVLYPQQAHVLAVEHTIALAGDAAAAGRHDDARRLLDVAATDVERVEDPATRQRLRDRIEEIRRSLPAATGPAAPASTPPTPVTPSAPAPSPGVTTPGHTPGSGGGDPTTGPGGLVPGLPTPQVPPLPGPSLPLPPLLPSLPPGLTG